MLRIRALISGKVQGVYFRQSTKDEADKLGIKGFAKNLGDGSVEVVAEGADAAVNKLIGFLHAGPEKAVVEKVIVNKEDYKGEFKRFVVC
ncbi:MAG: acylphosphatase [Candidatus Aenigmarchaeota archaeon]|nr:acylphosphatase [Candidatus Aenigmarchaeota archaeon]